jgi:hypothetical protein
VHFRLCIWCCTSIKLYCHKYALFLIASRCRQVFTVMNNSEGRSRLLQADRSAPVIPPLYDEEQISFMQYVRATSPVKGIRAGSVGGNAGVCKSEHGRVIAVYCQRAVDYLS